VSDHGACCKHTTFSRDFKPMAHQE